MGWKDRAQAVDVAAPVKRSWRDRAEAVEVAPSELPTDNPITAATTGIIQGAVPFAGALAGAGKAGLNAISGVTGPLRGGSFNDIVEDYRRSRDEFTGDAAKAAEANPGAALAGNLVGGLRNPLFEGVNTLGGSAAAGAAQALGMSEADLTQPGHGGEALIDAGLGAVGGAAGYGLGKAIPKLADASRFAGKKLLTNLGPTEEAINARLAGKARIENLKSYPELGEDLAGSVQNLGKEASDLSQQARSTLSKDNTLSGYDSVVSQIDQEMELLKNSKGVIVGDEKKAAFNKLKSLKEDLIQNGEKISENDVKDVIQDLDANTNWMDQGSKLVNNSFKTVRHNMDQMLKARNPAYQEAMKPVAERAAVIDRIARKFNLEHQPNKGLQPTDTTAVKLKGVLNDETRAVSQDDLKDLSKLTGKDYQDLAKQYQLAQQFEKGPGPQGSKRTALGAAVGGGLGTLLSPGVGTALGTGIGGAVGSTMDRYGGKAAGAIIDAYTKAAKSPAAQRFKPIMDQAAKKGPEALAVTASILSQNPDFRKAIGLE